MMGMEFPDNRQSRLITPDRQATARPEQALLGSGKESGMLGYLAVFLGGGLGAAPRHGVNRVALLLATGGFPMNTLFVNVIGSFVMGLLTGWFTWRGE